MSSALFTLTLALQGRRVLRNDITKMKISALQLFKHLPRTNCGECGFPTCLAFATQVVVEGADLSGCPYLSPEAQALAGTIAAQQENGVGRKRDNFAIALKFLEEKVAPLDFAALAAGVGGGLWRRERPAILED